ncbi:MAG: metallophosphoesterase [Thermodesulfobacteriota bacterium]
MPVRTAYVISDLHIGGDYGKPDQPEDRGFRLLTRTQTLVNFIQDLANKPRGEGIELIINGDFVDFLAERHPGSPEWMPFMDRSQVAVDQLDRIVDREKDHGASIVAALAGYLARGHRLVLIQGNHDLELSFPQVRAKLRKVLEAEGRDFLFLYDGEAYVFGDTVIEHGHRLDGFNKVDQGRLNEVRGRFSRGAAEVPLDLFLPPPGSRLVCEVMNPIKKDYPFVDLLKPETEALVPLLLALEPGYRKKIGSLLRLWLEAQWRSPRADDIWRDGTGLYPLRTYGTGLEGTGGGPLSDDAALNQVMTRVLGTQARDFMAALAPPMAEEKEEGTLLTYETKLWSPIQELLGLAALILGQGNLAERLPYLRQALQALQNDHSFDEGIEAESYLNPAQELIQGPIRNVVFGHTHLAKKVALGGGQYFNSGTWADLIEVPKEVMSGPEDQALAELQAFVMDLKDRRLSRWLRYRPTYVRLDLQADGRTTGELVEYQDGAAV